LTIVNPRHLFDQADGLVAQPAGQPRQADLRRAISAAYYGIFHAALTAAANLAVGEVNQTKSEFGLVYRSIDHKWLRELCEDIGKRPLPAKFRPHFPVAGPDQNMIDFATAVVELQEKRNQADYDPLYRTNKTDATATIATARGALLRLQAAGIASRNAFLYLLLFRPRR
jgi:hypothetical protein